MNYRTNQILQKLTGKKMFNHVRKTLVEAIIARRAIMASTGAFLTGLEKVRFSPHMVVYEK